MRASRLLPPLAVVVLGLTACSPIVGVEAAPDAANPECASVMVSLPDVVAENELRDTDSQATAAWGDPSQVVLRCGVAVPGPTTDACASVNGVDWIIQEEAEVWRATTYGRDPAVEILFDPNEVASSTILVDLGTAVSVIAQDSECLSLNDELELPSEGP
ncbi:DUF3515 domain-containing protein [Arthrobacter sp. 260]|uniref:DUF3515 domain-containing protein n=1 Tax=Arthrobacter sp. 260 TaxID=2735314 RepID=UPI001491BB32|nr:DUF3515 domain-containing protein [Arthrobacter sp. 260]NOJ60406.1 DUF3515 domain-containing protein [Arthrobacter sp. 260]